jgi:peptidoglycan/xylan/chitin deacetylase (PgdA/CDA1 family)/CelD/BcsL family acetyltransferase involved in cellulose biosynthesis
MKVVEIRSAAELQDLKPAWEALLCGSPSATIFLTWEWVSAWWQSYGKSRELRVLAAFDDNQVLRGIAPLCRETLRKYGQTFPALSFAGDGSNDSDYLDFLIASGYEEQVMRAFQAHWQEEWNAGTLLLLNEIPETSPNLPLLRSAAGDQKGILQEASVDCGVVRLPKTWEEYLGMLRPRFRTKIRSVLRDTESRPELRFGFCDTPEDLERLLPILFDLHTRRWVQDGKPGVFGWQQKREFYRALSGVLLERGWLRFSWLEWNGQILACQYGFAYGGAYFQLQEGYEPASEHWNTGIALRAWSIREFLKEGLREYDFLGGMGRHKSDWGAEVKRSAKIVLAGDSYKNRLFCYGPEWEAGARESVKNILPPWLLKLRQERLAQRSRAALPVANPSANGNGATSGGEWMRSAIANCYFHLRLPAVARPLRDQYQLCVSSNGKWPKVSWNRRREAVGRILYYHRVNDDNDPFFPAISTELFDQEMRYVSRHYKVVGMSELLDRLEGGSPEPVVAITFDDGYRDNYQNAYPILQRYGLTATIFLTTGSVDSGEPLWFEKLSLAVKKTEREYLDLEIDIPRRFWMRSLNERLETHGRIFKLLQQLEDPERRSRTDEILRQLGVDDSERRNKMLTWDEVRLMKAQGMDFGGHTVTHPFLAKMSREQVAWEASQCKRRIEEELQLPVDHFAYPNGREEDFGAWNKEVIRSAGYRAAVTTIWGTNHRSTDPMELRRGGPWEETPEMFAYKLDWYQMVDG